MGKAISRIAYPLIAVLAAAMSMTAGAGKAVLNPGSDVLKADYIFMEALRQKSIGNNDAYYELIDAAYRLNPSDLYLAKEQGTRALLLLDPADTSTAARDSAMHLIRTYVAENPSDLYAGMMFASLSQQLDERAEAAKVWRTMYESNGRRTDVGLRYVDALLASADTNNILTAMAIIDTLELREGVAPDFSMRRMNVYDQRLDTAAMKAEGMKLLASSPTNVQYVSFLGKLYLDLGDRDSSLVFFNRAVELDPTSGEGYYNRAMYYSETGDSLAYDREVTRAIALPDVDLGAKLEIVKAYVSRLYQDSIQQGRIDQMFKQLLSRYPHESDVRRLYADYLIATKDYSGAAEQKSYELDLNPADHQGWLMLASLYLQIDDMERARRAADRGLHYYPEEADLYELASVAGAATGDYDYALRQVAKARELTDSTDVEHLSSIAAQIGDIYYRMNKLDSVARYYDEALALNPANLTALNNYAYYISCQPDGDLDRALEMIERVMIAKKDDPTSVDTYAWVLFKRKDYDKSREIIDNALALESNPSGEILEHAGDIYFMAGKPDEALAFWRRALKLDPDNELLKRKVRHKTFFYK